MCACGFRCCETKCYLFFQGKTDPEKLFALEDKIMRSFKMFDTVLYPRKIKPHIFQTLSSLIHEIS